MKNKLIISLNGLDGYGKTTQINKLKSDLKLVKTFGNLGNGFIPKLDDISFSNWWFKESSVDEFLDAIYLSIKERNKEVLESNSPLILIDRGNIILLKKNNN